MHFRGERGAIVMHSLWKVNQRGPLLYGFGIWPIGGRTRAGHNSAGILESTAYGNEGNHLLSMKFGVDKQDDSVAVVRLTGRVDLESAESIRERLRGLVQEGVRHLVLDLQGVSFLDSTGLGALVSGIKTARLAGGDLRIARPGAQARLVLELTTLDRVLFPYASVDAALIGFVAERPKGAPAAPSEATVDPTSNRVWY